jgi:hypothetical protein
VDELLLAAMEVVVPALACCCREQRGRKEVGHGWNLCMGRLQQIPAMGEKTPSTMDPRGMKVLLPCAPWSLGREASMERCWASPRREEQGGGAAAAPCACEQREVAVCVG